VKREHVAIAALLLVLILALVVVLVGQGRDDSVSLPDSGRDDRAAGRALRLDELTGSCVDAGAPPRIVGGCRVVVAATDVPVRDLPVVRRWLPRELRRLDVALLAQGGGPCTAELEVRTGDIEVDADLDADQDRASISVDPAGGTVDVAIALGCVLVLDA
jgi:hypothetical protein